MSAPVSAPAVPAPRPSAPTGADLASEPAPAPAPAAAAAAAAAAAPFSAASSPAAQAAIRDSYAAYTLRDSVHNSKVACMLVIVLMPIGYLMDYFVYPGKHTFLLELRLMTSGVTALVLWAIRRPNLARWQYRLLCPGWYV